MSGIEQIGHFGGSLIIEIAVRMPSVTRMPLCASCSADHPPNAPAPTTITEDASAGERRIQAAPASAELLKKLRRELFADMGTSHVAFVCGILACTQQLSRCSARRS